MTETLNWKEIIAQKTLQPDEVDVVIYHHPCSDGTGSAFVAHKYLSTKFPDKNISYLPMFIGAYPPSGLEGKNVLICDYSYKKDILIELLKKVKKLLIIDHHKSAEKDLKDIDDKLKIFRMDFSGAMLTWYYFYPEVGPPLMIQYIQDRDIWTKKLPNTDDFASWFYTLPHDVTEYAKYLDDKLLLEMIQVKGKQFGELNNYYTHEAVEHSIPKFCKIREKYYFVAYVNSTVCKSDVGHEILHKFPLADFSAVYSISDASDRTDFSLRSTERHVDVSEVASSLGAGGHRNSSGLKLLSVTNRLPGETYNSGRLYNEISKLYYGSMEMNGKQYNIVYLLSNLYNWELGSYFLQDRYVLNNKPVQVCRDVSMKLGKQCPDFVHMSAIWNYDPTVNETNFTIVMDKTISKEERLSIDNWFSVNVADGITYSGIFYKIPLNSKPIERIVMDV